MQLILARGVASGCGDEKAAAASGTVGSPEIATPPAISWRAASRCRRRVAGSGAVQQMVLAFGVACGRGGKKAALPAEAAAASASSSSASSSELLSVSTMSAAAPASPRHRRQPA